GPSVVVVVDPGNVVTVVVVDPGSVVTVVVVDPGSVGVVLVVVTTVVVVDVPDVSSASTSSANPSAVASSTSPSPVVTQPPFCSAFANALSNAFSAFSMQSGSTLTPFVAAVAWHSSSADAYLALALAFDAAHLPPGLVSPSGNAVTTASTNSSTVVS